MSLIKSILSSLLGKRERDQRPQSVPANPVAPAREAKPQKERVLTLEGDEERTAYTYDPAPLKGTRKGSTFYADVVFRRTRLTSPSTGGTWDTATDGGVALARDGRLFGMTNTLAETFRELDKLGYSVRVKVKRLGMYDRVIPEVVLKIPHPSEIFFWRDGCAGLGREVPFEERHSEECEQAAWMERDRKRLSRNTEQELPLGVVGEAFFFEDGEWGGQKPNRGVATLDVSTEWIPTPKGSQAKPHIAVLVSGEKVRELNARNGTYKTMAEHVGEMPYLSTCKRWERGDGSYCWMVTVVYLPSSAI